MPERAPAPLLIADDETLAAAIARHLRDDPDLVFRLETAQGPITGVIEEVMHGTVGWHTRHAASLQVCDLDAPGNGTRFLELPDLLDVYPVARLYDGAHGQVPGRMFPRIVTRTLPQGRMMPESFHARIDELDLFDRLAAYIASASRVPAFRIELPTRPMTAHIVRVGDDHLVARDLDAWFDGPLTLTRETMLDVYAEGAVSTGADRVVEPRRSGRVMVWRPDSVRRGAYVASLTVAEDMDACAGEHADPTAQSAPTA